MPEYDPTDLAQRAINAGLFVDRTVADLPVVLQDREGRTLILAVDEGELYENALDAHGQGLDDYPARLALLTVDALERLGRLRANRLDELRVESVASMRDRVKALLADRLANTEGALGAVLAEDVRNLTYALRNLTGLADAENYIDSERVESELTEVKAAVVDALEVAGDLGADTYEGRLERLGTALNDLADAIHYRRPR